MSTNTPDNDPSSLSGVPTTPKISTPKRKFLGPFAVKTKKLLIVILENFPLNIISEVNWNAVDTGATDRKADTDAGTGTTGLDTDPEQAFRTFAKENLPKHKASPNLRDGIRNIPKIDSN